MELNESQANITHDLQDGRIFGEADLKTSIDMDLGGCILRYLFFYTINVIEVVIPRKIKRLSYVSSQFSWGIKR
jgi:hypothetical protein